MTLKAVLFDAYGTLFDVHSVAQLAERLYPGMGLQLSQLWRDKQIEYSRLVSMSGGMDAACSAHYRPFSELTRAGLRFAVRRLELRWSSEAEAQLMAAYLHLSAFPENRAVLVELQRRSITCGILSNGDPAMLEPVVRNAGFDELLQHVISVHPARRFKVDPAAYALGTAALGLPAHEILFVSSNCWDAIGATWFGHTTLWVNRAALPLDPLGTAPTHTGSSLHDVLALFPTA